MELPASPALRRIAGASWAFRWHVEREAERRFAHFAAELSARGAPGVLVEMAQKASDDEGRHIGLCAELAEALGEPVEASGPVVLTEIAPPGLSAGQKLTYEIVAACCVAETESTGTLATLLSASPEPRVREVLHAISRDEVQHARLGWAHLGWMQERGEASFVAQLIPLMFKPAEELFHPPRSPDEESDELPRWGVLPFHQRREVFIEVLRSVVFPGLDHVGVDSSAARAWLSTRVA